jgi:hypothetical protein
LLACPDSKQIDFLIIFSYLILIKESMKCAECQCSPLDCRNLECSICTKDVCCCLPRKEHPIYRFFQNASKLYATALAIEVLCIFAAEIGENSSFVIFGYRTAIGITLGYILGYGLSAFTTFATILGRSTYSEKMCSCCSVLDQGSNGFVATLLMTFKNCGIGVKKMSQLYTILWKSIIILVTAETACILTAETIDLIFYRHSLLISIPLSLLAGAFAVVVSEAYKKTNLESNRNFKDL